MVNLNGFDANTVDPMADFTTIPAGKYVGVITNTEMKPTKAGTGHYLELTFQIIEGLFKNRHLWARLNLDSPSEMAVRIARGELSAICRAVGVMQPKDSIELHNLPLVLSVKQKIDTDGELRNEIKGYSKKEAASGAPQQEGPQISGTGLRDPRG